MVISQCKTPYLPPFFKLSTGPVKGKKKATYTSTRISIIIWFDLDNTIYLATFYFSDIGH